ncbi:serine hydrolase domain-containing protein [Streptomyces sp. NPDC093093]|uniref:serine hydrolase domain-containing protein n=1 Tax=Streptomyces sp. NPDC093093 TaxID=3366025 RepID=UPI0037F5E027
MGRYKGRSLGGLILLVVLAGSACQSPQAGSVVSGGSDSGALDARTEAKVKQIVRRFKDTNRTPGVLVGIWSPKGTFVSATGVADLATGAPLRTDMQFKIASQTKTFTANLVLQLVGEGKVDLEDHISKWVPGVPNGDRITIRRLLNHTSGLADGFTSPTVQGKIPTGCIVAELLAAESKFPLSRLPAPSGRTAITVTTCSAVSWSWPAARI